MINSTWLRFMNVCLRSRHRREKRIEMRTKRECFNCAKEDFSYDWNSFSPRPNFLDNLFCCKQSSFLFTKKFICEFSRSTHHCDDDDRNLCVDRLKIAFLKNSASWPDERLFLLFGEESHGSRAHAGCDQGEATTRAETFEEVERVAVRK